MKSKKLMISEAAVSDLTEIWIYISEDTSNTADSFIDKIYEKCELISENPHIGRQRDELMKGIRSFPMRRYLIFYRIRSEVVEIVRILSGYRDLEEIF
jgi:toxin ParE1/3/4